MRVFVILVLVSVFLIACEEDEKRYKITYTVDCASCDIYYYCNGGVDSLISHGPTWDTTYYHSNKDVVPQLVVWYVSHKYDFQEHSAKIQILVDDVLKAEQEETGYIFKLHQFIILD